MALATHHVLERIEPHRIHLGRILLTLLAGLLYGVGVTAAHVVGVTLTVLGRALWCIGASAAWTVAAVKLGWDDARRPAGGT